MNPTGRQLCNTYHPDNNKEICIESAVSQSLNLSVQRANLISVCFYLNELQKRNLVTPSISRPFPTFPLTEEKMLLHKACRKLQQKRIFNLQNELLILKEKGVPLCYDTLKFKKLKLKKKISNLVTKFQPTPVNVDKCTAANTNKNKAVTNRKSRERYIARRFKKKLFKYFIEPKSRSVVNLSSIKLTPEELMALELGYGFVPSPNNSSKEEELLVLEGFRFVDRLGKADSYLE